MSNSDQIYERLKAYEDKRTDEMKKALKEAVQDWMDEKFKEIGRWTVRGFLVALFGALCYFIIHFGVRP